MGLVCREMGNLTAQFQGYFSPRSSISSPLPFPVPARRTGRNNDLASITSVVAVVVSVSLSLSLPPLSQFIPSTFSVFLSDQRDVIYARTT